MTRALCGGLTLAALLLSAAMLAAADKPDADAIKKELEKFQGNWTVASYEREGRKLAEEEAKQTKFELKEDKFTLTAGSPFTGKEGVLKLDPSKKVKEIDIIPSEGRNKGKTFKGIYEIDGDKLKVCAAAPDEPRPTEFATKAGSKTFLVTYQRDKK